MERCLLEIRGINELYHVYEGCRQANWDGFGAAPVSVRTFQSAYEFLEALPLGTPAPSIGAEPDGHITLEWHHSPRRSLSVGVSPESDLHYAAGWPAEKPAQKIIAQQIAAAAGKAHHPPHEPA